MLFDPWCIRLSRVVWCAVLCAAPTNTSGQSWEFTRVADYGTPVPGGTGTFRHVGFSAPGIHEGRVAFVGQNQAGVFEGVYSWQAGALSVVANTSTAIPNGQGNFIGFPDYSPPSLAGDGTTFIGNGVGELSIQQGIYIRSGPSLVRVVDRNTPLPNSSVNFFGIGAPATSEGAVAFAAVNLGGTLGGIYRWQNGTLGVVADHTTPIPGGTGTFTFPGDADIDAGAVAFFANGAGGQNGVYLADTGGALTRLYDTNSPVPGGPGNFTGFSSVSTENGRVAFRGVGPGGEGVYTDASGTLVALAQTGMPVPGMPGSVFQSGFGPSLDDGYAVFHATLNTGWGLFTNYGGALSKIIASGDVLDGRVVEAFGFSREGHHGDSIAFGVIFTDGWRGVYMGTIPGPGTLTLVALGLGAMIRRRR